MRTRKKAEAPQAKRASAFEVMWDRTFCELVNHLGITGVDVKEYTRQVWNKAVGTATDHARGQIDEAWRKLAVPQNQAVPGGPLSEEDDYMNAKDEKDAAQEKVLAVQTDLTGADEPITRPTILNMFDDPKPEPEPIKPDDDLFGGV